MKSLGWYSQSLGPNLNQRQSEREVTMLTTKSQYEQYNTVCKHAHAHVSV
jgi:hypothetical protein